MFQQLTSIEIISTSLRGRKQRIKKSFACINRIKVITPLRLEKNVKISQTY